MKILQALALILCSAALASAQKTIVTGTIYDANGARIARSKVTAVNQEGKKIEVAANEDGDYTLNLPYNPYDPQNINYRLAKYEITVEATGFEKFTLKDFKVSGGYAKEMQLDFALDVLVISDPIPVVPTENKKPE